MGTHTRQITTKVTEAWFKRWREKSVREEESVMCLQCENISWVDCKKRNLLCYMCRDNCRVGEDGRGVCVELLVAEFIFLLSNYITNCNIV